LQSRKDPTLYSPSSNGDDSALYGFHAYQAEVDAARALSRAQAEKAQDDLGSFISITQRPASAFEVRRKIVNAKEEKESKWGVSLREAPAPAGVRQPFKSYGAQGGQITRRLQSAKGPRGSPVKEAAPQITRVRPATAKPSTHRVNVEQREAGITNSRAGQYVGSLDKTSVLRMKVNLSFTQPTIPPPSPLLTGKAKTARRRNLYVEQPHEEY